MLCNLLQEEIIEAELLQLNVGVCPGAVRECGQTRPLITVGPRRQDYDDSCTVCTRCAQEYEQYWDEMWSDYWSSRL